MLHFRNGNKDDDTIPSLPPTDDMPSAPTPKD